MKLLLLALLLPAYLSAQHPNLNLVDKNLVFENKYSIDSGQSIVPFLSARIPTLKGVTDFYNGGEVMTAKFKDAYIDYRKYGGKWGNSPMMLNHPFTGDISIIWRDSAYKVTVSNIVFHIGGLGDSRLDDMATKNKGTEIRTGKGVITALTYINNHLTDLFMLKSSPVEW